MELSDSEIAVCRAATYLVNHAFAGRGAGRDDDVFPFIQSVDRGHLMGV